MRDFANIFYETYRKSNLNSGLYGYRKSIYDCDRLTTGDTFLEFVLMASFHALNRRCPLCWKQSLFPCWQLAPLALPEVPKILNDALYPT